MVLTACVAIVGCGNRADSHLVHSVPTFLYWQHGCSDQNNTQYRSTAAQHLPVDAALDCGGLVRDFLLSVWRRDSQNHSELVRRRRDVQTVQVAGQLLAIPVVVHSGVGGSEPSDGGHQANAVTVTDETHHAVSDHGCLDFQLADEHSTSTCVTCSLGVSG